MQPSQRLILFLETLSSPAQVSPCSSGLDQEAVFVYPAEAHRAPAEPTAQGPAPAPRITLQAAPWGEPRARLQPHPHSTPLTWAPSH